MTDQLHFAEAEAAGQGERLGVPPVIEQLEAANRKLRDSKARFQAAALINQLLASAPKGLEPGQKEAVAVAVLSLLDDPVFKKAADSKGHSCREAAVKVMLELGYPSALRLHPDDLAYYRERSRPSRAWLVLLVVAMLVIAGGFIFTYVSSFAVHPSELDLNAPVARRPEIKPQRFTSTLTGFEVDKTPVVMTARSEHLELVTLLLFRGDLALALEQMDRAETPADQLEQLPLKVVALHLQGDATGARLAYQQLESSQPTHPALPGLRQLLGEAK